MTTEPQTQVAAALGINVLALWSLSSNPQFPTPASGNGQNVLWNTSDDPTFTALWTAAKANGWKISTAELPVFNFTLAAANPLPSTMTWPSGTCIQLLLQRIQNDDSMVPNETMQQDRK